MKNGLLVFILMFSLLMGCSSQPDWTYPRIQDGADMLTPEAEFKIDSIFARHEGLYPHKLAFASTQDFEGETIYSWSQKKLTEMNLNDSGAQSVLFVINPVSRQVRIEVSAALRTDLPDRITSQVADNSILPELKKVDYYRAMFLGARGITGYLAAVSQQKNRK